MKSSNLRILREKCNYTQDEVSEYLNISRQTLYKWENGISIPDIASSKALADLYKVSLDEIAESFSNDNKPPKGKYLFGLVKVNEKGQILIPKEAREVFQIEPGDKLILLGDDKSGLALTKMQYLGEFSEVIKNMNMKDVDE